MLLSSTPIISEYFWEMDAEGCTISPGWPFSLCLRDLQAEKSIGKRSIRRKSFRKRIDVKVRIDLLRKFVLRLKREIVVIRE